MKYLSAWVCSFLSGAAVTAIRSLPICQSEVHRLESAISSRSGNSTPDKEKVRASSGHKLDFVLGLGFGLGIAFLWAPKSGAHTRSLIARRAREGSDYVKQQMTDLSDSAVEFVGK